MLSQELDSTRWVNSIGCTETRSKCRVRICIPHALASIYASAFCFVIKVGNSIESERLAAIQLSITEKPPRPRPRLFIDAD
jgi:hypothetical protein